MKKFVLILAFILASVPSMAQKRSDFKGPAYKNYKPWKHETVPTTLYVSTEKKSLKGPAYKNYKPWKDTSEKKAITINTSGTERQKLKGPAYKNYKPWRKKA